MTNKKLVDIVAGLPLVQIVWKFAALLSILAFMLLFEAAYTNAKKKELLINKVQKGIAEVLGSPLNTVSIKIENNESIFVQMGLHLKKFAFDVRSMPSLWLAIILILILLVWSISKNSLKRRSIFLRNFKNSDLEFAPQCTITRTKRFSGFLKNLGNINSWTGSIFKVKEQNDVYVVFNESPFKLFERLLTKYDGFRVGVLLKYEGHYFFYCSSWIPNFDFGDDD